MMTSDRDEEFKALWSDFVDGDSTAAAPLHCPAAANRHCDRLEAENETLEEQQASRPHTLCSSL